MLKNGLEINEQHYKFSFKAFICDAPARAFLKCITAHNAINRCERCEVRGVSKYHRVVFLDNVARLRSQEKFNELYPDHQNKVSLLQVLDLPLLHLFVLDYMHFVCLGVMRRLLTYLLSGPFNCRLSYPLRTRLSDSLMSLNGHLPSEFTRQPRSLKN